MKALYVEITDAMVKAAAMAVVQDIVWENGAPLTAEACWENAPAKLREKQLRQSRAALEAGLAAAVAVPQDTLTKLKYDTAVAFAAGFRKALREYDIDTGIYTVEGDCDSANVVPYAEQYANAHDPARYFE